MTMVKLGAGSAGQIRESWRSPTGDRRRECFRRVMRVVTSRGLALHCLVMDAPAVSRQGIWDGDRAPPVPASTARAIVYAYGAGTKARTALARSIRPGWGR